MKLMIRMAVLMVILTAGMHAQEKVVPAPGLEQEMNEYVVTAFDSGAWIVTARESTSGKEFRFRLPPAVFKGQTFNMEGPVPRKGTQFVVRGPQNLRLENMIVEGHFADHRMADKQRTGKPGTAPPAAMGFPSQKLEWEILSVQPKEFIVVARHGPTRRTIRFRVNPDCFIGMRFMAHPDRLVQGASFSMVIPNREAFKGCCTMLE